MKGPKKWLKKAGAVSLALILAAAIPVQGASQTEKTETMQSQETEGTETEQEKEQETEVSDLKENAGEDITEEENDMQEKSDPVEQNNNEKKKINEKQTEENGIEAKETEENGTEEKKAEENGTEEVSSSTADINKPVVESVIFKQVGQHLSQGDVLEVEASVYDSESGISKVNMTIDFYNTDTDSFQATIPMTNTEGNIYKGQFSLNGQNYTNGCISGIQATDQSGNVTMEFLDRESYSFTMDAPETIISVQDLQLGHKGETVHGGTQIDYSFSLNQEYPAATAAFLTFQNGTEEWSYTAEKTENGRFEGSINLFNNTVEGTWTLTQIVLVNENNQNLLNVTMDGMEEYYFIFENDQADKKPPVFKGISMSTENENALGQTFRPGESITFTIKAESESPLGEYAQIVFGTPAQVSSEAGFKSLMVYWDEESQAYKGTLEITEDFYPSEWYVESVLLWNDVYMGVPFDKSQVGDYYFYVQNDDTMVNPTYNVSINFMQLSPEGYWMETSHFYKEGVERRTSLSQLGFSYPEQSSPVQGVTQTGWEIRNWDGTTGQIPQEEDLVLSDMNYMVYATYDKVIVNFSYEYQDEKGNSLYNSQPVVLEEGSTYGDLEKYLNETVSPGEGYQGGKFTGWTLDLQGHSSEDILESSGVNIFGKATYSQFALQMDFFYIDQNDSWKSEKLFWQATADMTIGELREKINSYLPEDAKEGMPQLTWEYFLNADDQSSVNELASYRISVQASYEGKKVVEHIREYNGQDGYLQTQQIVYVVDAGTTYEQVYDSIEQEKLPEFYPGLKFEKWDSGYKQTGVIESNYSTIYDIAVYSNALITFIVDDRYTNVEGIGDVTLGAPYDGMSCIVAEKGESVTVPDTVEGCSDIHWVFTTIGDKLPQSGDVLEIPENGTYMVIGYSDSKETEEPDTSEEPDTPAEPDTSEEPDTSAEPDTSEEPDTSVEPGIPESPQGQLPQETVDEIIEKIQTAGPGETVVVPMEENTVISKEILENAKGKDVNLYLEMGGYAWSINGKNIQASEIQNIDLQVTVNSNGIPSSIVQQMAGDNPALQLSLAHEGEFGFKASLTIHVGQEYSGKYGNMYYYDSDGKMVYISTGLVGENGDISLDFSHASQYLVVFADQEMNQENVPEDLAPGTGNGQENSGDKIPVNGQTAENTENGTLDNGQTQETEKENSVKGQAVVADDSQTEKTTTTEKTSPETGDNNQTELFLLMAVGAMFLGTIAAVRKRTGKR